MEINSLSFSDLFLSKKYIFLLFGNLVSGIAIVFFNLFMASILTPDQFGVFIFVVSISIITSQIIIFGSSGFFLNQFGAEKHNQTLLHEQFLSHLLVNFIILLIISLLLSFLFVEKSSYFLSILFFSYVVTQVFLEINILITQITNNFIRQSMTLFIPHLLRIIAVLICTFLFDVASFQNILLFIFLANIGSIAILLAQHMQRVLFSLRQAVRNALNNYILFFKAILGFGSYELSFLVYSQLPFILMGILFNFDQVAIYSIVITISTIFILPSSVFTKAYHPLLQQNANKSSETHKQTVLKFIFAMIILGFLMGVICFIVGSLIPSIFLDANYSISADLIKIMSIFVFFRYLNSAISPSFYTKNYINTMALFMMLIIVLQFIFIISLLFIGTFNLFLLTYLAIALEVVFFILCVMYLFKRILN